MAESTYLPFRIFRLRKRAGRAFAARALLPENQAVLSKPIEMTMPTILCLRIFRRAVTAAVLCFAPLCAHDMWMEPTTFSPESGEIVGVRLRVGQDLLGDPLPRDSGLIQQFFVEDSEGRKPLVGRDGGNPAGYLRVVSSGLMIIGYRSNPSAVELTADKFNQYLKDEGLDAIAAMRARRGQTAAPAHELFSRCAKSLVVSGTPKDTRGDRRLGFTLELVAERNPYTVRAGDEIPIRLTYLDRPLAGALVVALNRLNPAEKLTARSGVDGRVRFRLRPGGMWLIKAVHMIPAPAGTNAEWTSFWASLTFEPPAANASAKVQ
jgi:uncharacterized GH25 family protein